MHAVRARSVALLVGCGAFLAGCGDGTPAPGTSTSTTASSTPDAATPSPTEGGTMDPDVRGVVDAATADLLGRVATGSEPVRVVLARTETFPTAALGCPRPGEDYAAAPVDGYRVLLGRGERVWLYTADTDGVPRLCPSEEKDGGREFVPSPGMTG